jgi:hypothetical protein
MVYVSQEASNDYVYEAARHGSAGIPEAASDYDHHLIDNASKLLTSKYPGITDLALKDLQTTV